MQDRVTGELFDPVQGFTLAPISKEQTTEKEVNAELPKIIIHLTDTQTADWQIRVNAMKRLQELAPNLQLWLPKLINPLKAQIHDLRSVSAREAGLTI